MNETSLLTSHPLTEENWHDFELLFGPKGACDGCWCMFFILPNKQYWESKGEKNRALIQKIVVEDHQSPGIIAYYDQKPAGWIAIAPREKYARLQNSRILKPVDDQPVWSIVCFFVGKEYRKTGINHFLIQAAIHYAKENGASIVEAYPMIPKEKKVQDLFAYTGFFSTFQKEGFEEVARRSPTRPIMRYAILDF
jgi:GNAT superfamily N-acetyltransferase